ncbi:hypothetical protein D0Z08_05860 [Nocardioides immobilis]|uniref:Terminase small subunit n=1 Tax=Nocardioides immobilis TaxID=2049295 RepID=A0A417Y562_9ACTN|nr:hypothetical protein [Nocardioides immobilis]RHW27822.1 hypothetical protein D0Z08_05860 [Nocardioides immobilis]
MTDPSDHLTIEQAAENGTRRDLLVSLRRRLAAALDDDRTQPRDLSPITLRLRELAEEIAGIDAEADDPIAASDFPDEPFDATAL